MNFIVQITISTLCTVTVGLFVALIPESDIIEIML